MAEFERHRPASGRGSGHGQGLWAGSTGGCGSSSRRSRCSSWRQPRWARYRSIAPSAANGSNRSITRTVPPSACTAPPKRSGAASR